MLAIDADSHFVEPLDLYEKYIDPGMRQIVVDNKALQVHFRDFLLNLPHFGQGQP
jgi:hypothetical protein